MKTPVPLPYDNKKHAYKWQQTSDWATAYLTGISVYLKDVKTGGGRLLSRIPPHERFVS